MIASLRRLLHRWRIVIPDRLRFSPALRWLLYHRILRFRASRRPEGAEETVKTIEDLCSAARLAVSADQILSVEKRIQALPVAPNEASAILGESDGLINKVAVLKPHNDATGERGVIFISFEYEWAKLLGARNLDEFARRYHLVVSPTWTPPHSAVNCLFPEIFPEPVYCLISNVTDLGTFPRLSDNYRMIDLFASSWVDPKLFDPLPPGERDIDLIMLANFGIYKRHHVLFRALGRLPDTWKVVLVGQPNGSRNAEVLLSEAECFGVRDRIELRQRLSDEEVCELLCRARMSLICSRREGSCVAVVESMFANTPVALLKGAGIGSAKFVNASTGAFLDESRLATELLGFHESAAGLSPRAWCLENGLDAKSSSRRLNDFLAADCQRRGLPWTADLLPMHWRPDPRLSHPQDAPWLDAEVRKIYELTGIKMEVSHRSGAE